MRVLYLCVHWRLASGRLRVDELRLEEHRSMLGFLGLLSWCAYGLMVNGVLTHCSLFNCHFTFVDDISIARNCVMGTVRDECFVPPAASVPTKREAWTLGVVLTHTGLV